MLRYAAVPLLVVAFGGITPTQSGAASDVCLTGRIVSVLHEGVPAAEVWATDEAGKVLARAITDGDGHYQLRNLPPTPLVLRARGHGCVEGATQVSETGVTRVATLQLEDGADLKGSVKDPNGAAITGAAVVVYAPRLFLEQPWRVETTTRADGTFVVPMAPLRTLTVSAWSPGCQLTDRVVSKRTPAPVEVVLPPGPRTPRTVRVLGIPEGQQASLRCWHADERKLEPVGLPDALRRVAVTPDGTAELWPLPFEQKVYVDAPGCTVSPVYELCAAGSAADLKFVLTELPADLKNPRTRLAGIVVDELGKPLADVRVVAGDDNRITTTVATGVDGAFALDMPVRPGVYCKLGLAPGAWLLGDTNAQLGPNGARWLAMAADATKQIKLNATRAGTIRGVAVTATGEVIASATLRVATVPRRSRMLSATDAAGRFEVRGLPAGCYEITVYRAGGVCGKATVDLPPGGIASPGAFEILPAGELVGVVRDGLGKPAAGVLLTIDSDVDPGRGAGQLVTGSPNEVVTDRNGRFRFYGVGPGSWFVCDRQTHPGQTVKLSDAVVVEAGRTTKIDLSFDK